MLKRISGLAGEDFELIGGSLAVVSLIAGVASWLQFSLSLGATLAVIALSFVALLLCLAHRFTFWIPLLLGTAVFGGAVAVFCAALGGRVHNPVGLWVGGIAGLLLGFFVASRVFLDAARALYRPNARDETAKPRVRRRTSPPSLRPSPRFISMSERSLGTAGLQSEQLPP